MEDINKNALVDTYISNIELSVEIDSLKNKYNNLENNLVELQNMISDTLEEGDN
ncbi:MAG: hypothetical protein HXK70_06000 [Clostridiales bacterium]|nr:hypothetical protein [Clostridiales bacterium]